jgi:ParB family chromosome partitioning protein
VESIVIGRRHRADLGDIDSLVESISHIGLLQPITVTADGLLICGRRRLEAIKRLGWLSVQVWMNGTISDRLGLLVAELDENATHKPLTATEQAHLYAEVREAMREDAARRQEASRFGNGESPEPALGSRHSRESRVQASRFVSGRDSHQMLDCILQMERYAFDRKKPAAVRATAEAELEAIRNGGAVDPSWQRFQAVVRAHESLHPVGSAASDDDLSKEAHAVLDAARADRRRRIAENRAKREAKAASAKRSPRAFALTWAELDGWSRRFEFQRIAREVKPDDWAMFRRVVDECRAFTDAVERERRCPERGSEEAELVEERFG